ncbi:MAG: hypothetical protein ACE5IK_01435 [Acidobacteriota bacterium]
MRARPDGFSVAVAALLPAAVLLVSGCTTADAGSVPENRDPESPVVDTSVGVAAAGPPIRGFCLDAPGRSFTARVLDPVADTGAGWISLTPFAWQRGVHEPHVGFSPSADRVIWGESDEGLTAIVAAARARGLSVLLSPHIWLHRSIAGGWRGDIEMTSETDWQSWFADYRAFILHHARLAERLHIKILSVGLELRQVAVTREADWRRLIDEVRRVYHGKLTYSANWYEEPEKVAFWDALDYIGIQGYFPLGSDPSPSLDELRAGWRPHRDRLERLAQRTGKPILFTEIGYKSSRGATVEPWTWQPQGAPDGDLQARAYQAVLDTFWDEPWFAGLFLWQWQPGRSLRPSPDRGDFTPQGKPALAVVRNYFGRSAPAGVR